MFAAEEDGASKKLEAEAGCKKIKACTSKPIQHIDPAFSILLNQTFIKFGSIFSPKTKVGRCNSTVKAVKRYFAEMPPPTPLEPGHLACALLLLTPLNHIVHKIHDILPLDKAECKSEI